MDAGGVLEHRLRPRDDQLRLDQLVQPEYPALNEVELYVIVQVKFHIAGPSVRIIVLILLDPFPADVHETNCIKAEFVAVFELK